jgi:circadian clock protein KaiC
MTDRVQIRKLSTGVPGLDAVLGGGVPELSFNLIAGAPGAGKTMLAHQFMFFNASEERQAIYFTIFGEPAVKMLRYQQQFEFFDHSKVNGVIRFVHLGEDMIEGGLARVLDRIRRELETGDPRIVVVDSFRSVVRVADGSHDETMGLERFVQLLALMLTTYEATTFLVGEYLEQETNSNPVFTVADGIVWLYQTVIRNSVVRRLQVLKMRGQAQIPGLHTIKLSARGMRVFSRLPMPSETGVDAGTGRGPAEYKKTGVRGLDEMLGGGIPTGYSMLIAGPSGSGKTMLATQFVIEGARRGEPAVIAVFEKRPQEYLKTNTRGAELDHLVQSGAIKLMYIRPLDLSVDETLEELREEVIRLGTKRVVIDSLSGFELALAPSFRDDFRESLYRMVGALTGLGVTVVLTVEVTDSFTELRLSPQGISFLTDGIILQRYVEIDGSLRKVMTVVKLRANPHSKEFRQYEIGERGIVMASGPLDTYRGLLTGVPLAITPAPKRGGSPAAKPKGATKKRRRK